MIVSPYHMDNEKRVADSRRYSLMNRILKEGRCPVKVKLVKLPGLFIDDRVC